MNNETQSTRAGDGKSPAASLPLNERLGDMRHYLNEAHQFAAMSPRGRDCIGIVLDLLDEMEPEVVALAAAPAAPDLSDDKILSIWRKHYPQSVPGQLTVMAARDVIAADRAMLAAAPAVPAPAWQPIETAPKGKPGEGTHAIILGFAPDEEGYSPGSIEGGWNHHLGRWSSTLDPGWTSSPQPTHWQPLPANPSEIQAPATAEGSQP